MKIIRLSAENIKKLVAVEITPEGNLVKITGANGAGKTSVLDSIYWALAGERSIDQVPLRSGTEKGKVELDLGDVIVKRTFTEAGTALIVENKDGLKYPSPQKMLDGLLGRMSFDPLEFMGMKNEEQFKTLMELTGIDHSELDEKKKLIFDNRTLANREVKSIEARYNGIVLEEGIPAEESNITELAKELADARTAKSERDAAVKRISEIDTGIANATNMIADMEKKIAEQKAIIEKANGVRKGLVAISKKMLPNIEALEKKFATADETNVKVRMRKQKEALARELSEAKKAAAKLDDQLSEIEKTKQHAISKAKFPIDGLSFGDGMVTYKNLPLNQASDAEKLRVSMAMAMAMNPKLRVIRVKDGSLLDSKSLKIVEELASKGDFQVWMEIVDESGKVGIVIEDGSVKAVNGSIAVKEKKTKKQTTTKAKE